MVEKCNLMVCRTIVGYAALLIHRLGNHEFVTTYYTTKCIFVLACTELFQVHC